MFLLSILEYSLLVIFNAFSTPTVFDTSTDVKAPEPTSTSLPNAVGPVTQFHVANKCIQPDGYNRSTTLVNGIFPGPLIQAKSGDRFSIQVFNELTDPTMPLDTSIHWHGIFQRESNWADGASSVTQCPILPAEQFEYKFHVTGQSGTYWYHSHYATQYCDGLRGPLVIYDPDDPLAHLYDVDDENTVITLSDWYHIPSIQVIAERLFAPDATLINGQGRYAGGPETQLAVINVQHGLRYRFRLVGTSCDVAFNFSIDSHRLTIIEADGNEVTPVDVDWLPVFAGQRYSVIATANQTVGNYWIRALPNITGASFDGDQNMAILRYDGAPDVDPVSVSGPGGLSFDEGNLHPLINPGAPGIPEIGKADMNIQLDPGFNLTSGFFEFNNASFFPPTVPVLLQILSGAKHAMQLMPNGSVYVLPPNKVIELSFPDPANALGGPHPIHLHGHSFDVVRVSGTNVTNFVNPVRRDVVSIGATATDNVTIRFVTNNPGPWFLHCHIDWHLNLGFAAVMAEAPRLAAEEESKVVPAEWYKLCPSAQPGLGQTPLALHGSGN